LKFIKGNKA